MTTCRMCRTRSVAARGHDGYNVQLCTPCYDYAGWENTHSDDGHDELDKSMSPRLIETISISMEMCPVCHPELDRRDAPPVTGHKNTVAKSWSSHDACKHARTSKARAQCRKERK